MNDTVRCILAGGLLFVAAGGAKDFKVTVPSLPWAAPTEATEKPDGEALSWAEGLRAKTTDMPPEAKAQAAVFYDAMAVVLERASEKSVRVTETTDLFEGWHAAATDLAVDMNEVGKYPGLGESIDAVFMKAVGDESRKMTDLDKTKLARAARAIAWVIGGR